MEKIKNNKNQRFKEIKFKNNQIKMEKLGMRESKMKNRTYADVARHVLTGRVYQDFTDGVLDSGRMSHASLQQADNHVVADVARHVLTGRVRHDLTNGVNRIADTRAEYLYKMGGKRLVMEPLVQLELFEHFEHSGHSDWFLAKKAEGDEGRIGWNGGVVEWWGARNGSPREARGPALEDCPDLGISSGKSFRRGIRGGGMLGG